MDMRFRFTWIKANDSQELEEIVLFAAMGPLREYIDTEADAHLLVSLGIQEMADESYVTSVSFLLQRPQDRIQFSTYLQWHDEQQAMVEYLLKNPERVRELWDAPDDGTTPLAL